MPERHVTALNRSHILPEISVRQNWFVQPPVGTQPEDLEQPEYWKHVAQSVGIQPKAKVTALCEDGTWMAEYFVLHVGSHHIKMMIIKPDANGVVSLEEVSDLAQETEQYEVKWGGPAHMYVVKRRADNETMEKNFKTKALAAAWMHANLSNMAA